MRARAEAVHAGAPWTAVAGAALFAFAWTYPHFLEGRAWTAYLYAAPVGLVPCPTLALLASLVLLGDGIDRRVAGVVAGLAAFYGAFGVLRLGVRLDLGLLAGAAAVAALALRLDASALARSRIST